MADSSRQALQALQRLFTAIRIARPQRGPEQRFEQICLAVGRRAEDAQVAGSDSEAGELVGGAHHFAVGLVVNGLALALLRLDDAEVLQLGNQLLARTGLLDYLIEGQVSPRGVDQDRPPHSPAGGALVRAAARWREVAARRQLLADYPQRQELVALQLQDRPQPFHIGLAVEAVAASRTPRRQELLVLEVADLRDRDVVELTLQDLADGADRQCLARPRVALASLLLGDCHPYFSR